MTISANNRTRVVVLLTSVALALVLLLAFAVSAKADDAVVPPGVTYVDHLVQTGDTLWDIAGDHTPAGGDVRNVIVDIKTANHLDSSVIVPGQVLLIPTPAP
jgi:hypothetical protein